MSGISTLIAASKGKSMSSGRKAKITKAVQKHVTKAPKEKVAKAVDHVLAKPDAASKNDDALIAEIKAVLKGSFMVTSGIDQLIEAAGTPTQVYTLGVKDSDGSLWRLLEYLKKCGDDGHSVSFTIDDQSFGFDGDGSDKIVTMDRDEAP
jgi:hypothetical protein